MGVALMSRLQYTLSVLQSCQQYYIFTASHFRQYTANSSTSETNFSFSPSFIICDINVRQYNVSSGDDPYQKIYEGLVIVDGGSQSIFVNIDYYGSISLSGSTLTLGALYARINVNGIAIQL